eukprot:g30957.t1
MQVLLLKFKQNEQKLEMEETGFQKTTIADLTQTIGNLFGLDVETMKLVGLDKKTWPPTTLLADLPKFKKRKPIKLLVLGTAPHELEHLQAAETQMEIERTIEEMEQQELARQRAAQAEAGAEAQRLKMAQRQEQMQRQELQRRQAAQQMEAFQREQERQRMQMARAMEVDHDASLELKLPCFYGPEADKIGKLILPPSVLQKLVDSKVSFPIIFEIRRQLQPGSHDSSLSSTSSSQLASQPAPFDTWYMGVSDFSAPEDSVIAPKILLDKLKIEEGNLLLLKTVQLPKGNFAQLQALTPSWKLLPAEQREALLEFELRRHQYLNLGEDISLLLNGQRYHFAVSQLRPEKPAVSITDTDLSTEVIVPGDMKAVVHTDNSEGSRLEVDGDPVQLNLRATDGYWRTNFEITEPNSRLMLSMRVSKGNCVLYVSPAQRPDGVVQLPPSRACFIWALQEGSSDELHLNNRDPSFLPGAFAVAVCAVGESVCNVQISLRQDARSSKVEASGEEAKHPECPHCKRKIPAAVLAMHEARCARLNMVCSSCHPPQVILRSNQKIHQEIVHTPMMCPLECGASMAQTPMQMHLKEHCQNRLVPCLYCPLHVRVMDRGPHQGECGTRPAACKICSQSMPRKKIYHHLEAVHGMDRASLSWKDLVVRTPSKTWK